MKSLLEKMQQDLVIQNYSPRTIELYKWHVKVFLTHFAKPAGQITDDDIRDYLFYVKAEKHYSVSNLAQSFSAIKFLFRQTVKMPLSLTSLKGPKRSRPLPLVLSKEEVKQVLGSIKNDKHRMLLELIYSAGLRLHEATHLKVTNIDSQRMTIHVQCGKGNKDRYTILSKVGLKDLRDYWKRYRPRTWLFPGRDVNKPIGDSYLNENSAFNSLLSQLYEKSWVTYCKKPFGGPKQVLGYLGCYTHRVAISNHRIVKVADGKVTFRWRDYRDHNKTKLMTLELDEFMRRFLLHILPARYYKIRYYGLFSNRYRTAKLSRCQEILDVTQEETLTKNDCLSWQDLLLELCGLDVRKCPECKKGQMVRMTVLHRSLDVPP